jgi:site-specific DNA-methyltransferase (adenine-specific)
MEAAESLSTAQAARLLGYSRQHVGRLVREGRLQAEKPGRDIMIFRDSVEAFLRREANLDLPLAVPEESGAKPPAPDSKEASLQRVSELLGGPTEPSLEHKRLAKRIAWSNGMRPRQTNHRIIRGDARDMAGIGGTAVDLVVTSPPYFNLIDYEGDASATGQLGDIGDYEAFLDELDEVWSRCYDLLTPGGRLCVVVGDVCLSRREAGRHHVLPLHADIGIRARRIGFDFLTPILWSKIANMATEVGGGARFLGKPYEPNAIIKNDVEYILLLRKPGAYRKPTLAQRALSLIDAEDHRRWFRSVWTDVPGESRRAGHPAPFPAKIAHRLISMFSFVGDTVLDPFWGTGSTTVAAIEAGRSSIGYEIEDRYFQIGKQRLAQLDAASVPAQFAFAVEKA